jgi:hypothetical protein
VSHDAGLFQSTGVTAKIIGDARIEIERGATPDIRANDHEGSAEGQPTRSFYPSDERKPQEKASSGEFAGDLVPERRDGVADVALRPEGAAGFARSAQFPSCGVMLQKGVPGLIDASPSAPMSAWKVKQMFQLTLHEEP